MFRTTSTLMMGQTRRRKRSFYFKNATPKYQKKQTDDAFMLVLGKKGVQDLKSFKRNNLEVASEIEIKMHCVIIFYAENRNQKILDSNQARIYVQKSEEQGYQQHGNYVRILKKGISGLKIENLQKNTSPINSFSTEGIRPSHQNTLV